MKNEYDNRVSRKEAQKIRKALWLNQPLEDKEKDLFYMDISSQEIAGAIDSGAGMIGIISDFGGGKSTLSRYLAEEDGYRLCNICLWSLYGLSGKDDMQNVSEMTHSFFYQMAKTAVSPEAARHVNKMFNKNYGRVSIEISSRGEKFLKTLMIVFLLIMTAAGVLPGIIPNLFGQGAKLYGLIQMIVENGKEIAVLMLIIALVWGKGSLIFSDKESLGNRSLGIADTYEIFDYIISEACKRAQEEKKKYLICIEDLDRVESREDIACFLKEIYQYYNLLSKAEKEHFVFLVSVSQKLYGDIVASNNENGAEERLYSKVFDYMIELKPISEKQSKDLTERLINQMESQADLSKYIENGEEKQRAIEWISKGKNLGVRELKFRLNRALSIAKALEVVDRKEEFDKCALTAYLEEQYLADMYYLLHNQEQFNRFMEEIKKIKTSELNEEKLEKKVRKSVIQYEYSCNGLTEKRNRKTKGAGAQTRADKRFLSKAFVEEWINILCTSTITDDYENYFFRKIET